MQNFLKTPINQTATKENPKPLPSNPHKKNPTTQNPNPETPFNRTVWHSFPIFEMHAESAVVGRRKGEKKKSLITIDGNQQFNQYKHCNFIDFYFIDFFKAN